jgi:hypothetical protein
MPHSLLTSSLPASAKLSDTDGCPTFGTKTSARIGPDDPLYRAVVNKRLLVVTAAVTASKVFVSDPEVQVIIDHQA